MMKLKCGYKKQFNPNYPYIFTILNMFSLFKKQKEKSLKEKTNKRKPLKVNKKKN